MFPPTIQKLIDFFSTFPTVGPKTAARFAFFLKKLKKEKLKEFVNLLKEIERVKTCKICFNSFEGEGNICQICADRKRDNSLLCVVANEMDLEAIERTKKYRGLYFVLGGLLSPLKKEKNLKIEELEKRAKDPKIKEIILALNPTPEGEITTLYLERKLSPLNKKITKLAKGLPVGGELEYADEETLASALENRK